MIYYACMPLVANVPDPRHDWTETTCPECGAACWKNQQDEPVLAAALGPAYTVRFVCTDCALRLSGEYYGPEREPDPPPFYAIGNDGRSITCHVCGLTSWNPNDVAQKYCGCCHVFHDQREMLARLERLEAEG